MLYVEEDDSTALACVGSLPCTMAVVTTACNLSVIVMQALPDSALPKAPSLGDNLK